MDSISSIISHTILTFIFFLPIKAPFNWYKCLFDYLDTWYCIFSMGIAMLTVLSPVEWLESPENMTACAQCCRISADSQFVSLLISLLFPLEIIPQGNLFLDSYLHCHVQENLMSFFPSAMWFYPYYCIVKKLANYAKWALFGPQFPFALQKPWEIGLDL